MLYYLLLVALVSLAEATEGLNYKRLILAEKVSYVIDNNINALIDLGHQRALTSGFFTQAQFDVLLAGGIQFYNDKFGLDFAGKEIPFGGYNQSGVYVIPLIATMYPFAQTDDDYIIIADTKNPERAGNCTYHYFGFIVIVNTTQEYTPGSFIKPGNLLSYVNGVIDCGSNGFEKIALQDVAPGLQAVNSEGRTEQFTKMRAVDGEGRVGLAITNTMILTYEGHVTIRVASRLYFPKN